MKRHKDFQNKLSRMESYLHRLVEINKDFGFTDADKISSLTDYMNDLEICIKIRKSVK